MLDEREIYMRMALQEAAVAAEAGEVPVGAIIVSEDKLVAKAHNQVEMLKDATAHAEMIAITQASAAVGDWRLEKATLYVTREPCPMCRSALSLARIPKVVFGTTDPSLAVTPSMKEPVSIEGGILEDECRGIIQEFFRQRRAEKKQQRTHHEEQEGPKE